MIRPAAIRCAQAGWSLCPAAERGGDVAVDRRLLPARGRRAPASRSCWNCSMPPAAGLGAGEAAARRRPARSAGPHHCAARVQGSHGSVERAGARRSMSILGTARNSCRRTAGVSLPLFPRAASRGISPASASGQMLKELANAARIPPIAFHRMWSATLSPHTVGPWRGFAEFAEDAGSCRYRDDADLYPWRAIGCARSSPSITPRQGRQAKAARRSAYPVRPYPVRPYLDQNPPPPAKRPRPKKGKDAPRKDLRQH